MNFSERVNWHTHTQRCKHATGNVNDYCLEAQKQGLAILGFSDHSPFPDGRFDSSRMDFSELGDYRDEVESAKGKFGKLQIFAGLEVDISDPYGLDYVEKVLQGTFHFDYLIAGVHFRPNERPAESLWTPNNFWLDDSQIRDFIDANIRLIRSGYFRYIAHPDIWMGKTPRWSSRIEDMSRELLQSAVDCGVFLEVNAYGLRKKPITTPDGICHCRYPYREFWRIAAELGVKTVVGSDAHRPEDVWSNTEEAFTFARSLGLNPDNAGWRK